MSNTFDERHEWTGDSVEPESAAFQAGKAQALDKLLPYAHSDSKREAASVVLELDGREFFFGEGDKYSVSANIPAGRPVAHLHSHSDPEPQSLTDWQEFLSHDSVRQAHVVGPQVTYSLHKPSDWKAPSGQKPTDIGNVFYDAYDAANAAGIKRGAKMSDQELDEAVTWIMADRYGILFRIGKRDS